MPDTLLRTEHIWMFGRRCDFKVYRSSPKLQPFQYEHDAKGNPMQRQKNQIVMHDTAGNRTAQAVIDEWNLNARGHCRRSTASPCPVDGSGSCPIHSVPVMRMRTSAHYIVELSQDRLNANQPYTDVIEVMESAATTWHANPIDNTSIGILLTNVGYEWTAAADQVEGTGANRRPVDHNRWIHLDDPVREQSDFQAYEEQQYRSMIMLLRSLCIKHRIPRRFLGDTIEEKMQRWWHLAPARTRSRFLRFRGILSHMNCHETNACGGPALHRDRLFRGIIDEWWMPVDSGDEVRPYYMGPFDPQASVPSFVRWGGQRWQADLFHDADPERLQCTRSYFDIGPDAVRQCYEQTETKRGGTFPVGLNRVWHGGVHLFPPPGNPRVYAAASGTIVAARLGGDQATEEDPAFGSQRFVLVRHAVYLQSEEDPGGGRRIAYDQDPTYVFSLCMHLAPIANLNATDVQNPPWFNVWRRGQRGDVDPAGVFYPDVEVAVGDWIGDAGTFAGERMIHFEVMSRVELTTAPWNDQRLRAYDNNDSDALCDVATLDALLEDRARDGLDTGDILAAAPRLRKVKSYHKSEWALAGPEALDPLDLDDDERDALWERLRHFMWVADAVAACPDLEELLCDARGFVWHYHPITFMDHVNRLIHEENGEMHEPDATNTNVTIDGAYLARFVSYAGGAAVEQAADNSLVRPYDVSSQDYQYHLTRIQLACSADGAHECGVPPTQTWFHMNLLDLLESVRVTFGQEITVACSHVCANHAGKGNEALCVLGTASALAEHAAGHAVDVRPQHATPASCAALWDAISSVLNEENGHDASPGEPSRGQSPYGLGDVEVRMPPDLQERLEQCTALTEAQAAQCVFHIELLRSGTFVRSITILVHGVNTNAAWYGLVEDEMKQYQDNIVVARSGAEYTLRDLVVPFTWGDYENEKQGGYAWYAADEVHQIFENDLSGYDRVYQGHSAVRLKEVIDDARRLAPQVNVIAHSNGTLITCAALLLGASLDNFILMGSPLDCDNPRSQQELARAVQRVSGTVTNFWSWGDEWASLKGGIGAFGDNATYRAANPGIANVKFEPGAVIEGVEITVDDNEIDHSDYMLPAHMPIFSSYIRRWAEQTQSKARYDDTGLTNLRAKAQWTGVSFFQTPDNVTMDSPDMQRARDIISPSTE